MNKDFLKKDSDFIKSHIVVTGVPGVGTEHQEQEQEQEQEKIVFDFNNYFKQVENLKQNSIEKSNLTTTKIDCLIFGYIDAFLTNNKEVLTEQVTEATEQGDLVIKSKIVEFNKNLLKQVAIIYENRTSKVFEKSSDYKILLTCSLCFSFIYQNLKDNNKNKNQSLLTNKEKLLSQYKATFIQFKLDKKGCSRTQKQVIAVTQNSWDELQQLKEQDKKDATKEQFKNKLVIIRDFYSKQDKEHQEQLKTLFNELLKG